MSTSTTSAAGAALRRSPFHYRDFRLLAGGTAISALGNAISPVALAFAVLDLGGSAAELGLVVAAFVLAEVGTLLLGGVLGDRVPRRLLLTGSAAGAMVVQAVVAAALLGGWASVPGLAVAGAIAGCLGALGMPSSQALTRQVVPEDQLGAAVALRRLVQHAAAVAGYALGGILVAGFGPGWAITVDALTFAVAAGCFAFLRPAGGRTAADATGRLAHDLVEGGREVLRHGWLWLLIGQALLYHLFYGGVQGVLGPVVVGERWGAAAWGWSLAVLMAGFLVGGMLSLRWRPRRGLAVGTALLTLTAAFPLAVALADTLPLLLAGAFLHGLGLELFSVNWDLAIQQNVPEERLARVYSFDAVGSFVARPVGLVLVGPVSATAGTTAWLLVVAAVMGVSSLLAAAAPAVRRLERR
ncbi:MAG: MFS transporter [Phycicoccus sp.]